MEILKIKLADYLEILQTQTLVEVFLETRAQIILVVVYSVIIPIIKHNRLNNRFQGRFTFKLILEK